ncbi:MAG: hypothetical protein ACPGRX_05780 [Bdellovibrionales bacterium]
MNDQIGEKILNQLGIVLENIDALEEKFDKKFSQVDQNFKIMEKRFDRLETSITLVGGDVDQLKRRVGRIERHLDIIHTDLGN